MQKRGPRRRRRRPGRTCAGGIRRSPMSVYSRDDRAGRAAQRFVERRGEHQPLRGQQVQRLRLESRLRRRAGSVASSARACAVSPRRASSRTRRNATRRKRRRRSVDRGGRLQQRRRVLVIRAAPSTAPRRARARRARASTARSRGRARRVPLPCIASIQSFISDDATIASRESTSVVFDTGRVADAADPSATGSR